MSSDVSWHIRDKLRPMPKHGSTLLYVHGNRGSLGWTAQDSHHDSHTAPELWTPLAQHTSFNTLDNWGHKTPAQSKKRKNDRKEKGHGPGHTCCTRLHINWISHAKHEVIQQGWYQLFTLVFNGKHVFCCCCFFTVVMCRRWEDCACPTWQPFRVGRTKVV